MSKENVVRILSVKLKSFKNVAEGKIELYCGRLFDKDKSNRESAFTGSDILGVFGPNASGKSAVIEAISILKFLMSGKPLPSVYGDCIAIGEECAELEFVFGMSCQNGFRKVTYSFCLGFNSATSAGFFNRGINGEASDADVDSSDVLTSDGFFSPIKNKKLLISNEKISLMWEKAQKRENWPPIIDTSNESVFTSETKRKKLVGDDRKNLEALNRSNDSAKWESRSFVFAEDTLNILTEQGDKSIPLAEVLSDLKHYAINFLHVLDTKSLMYVSGLTIPIHTETAGLIVFDVMRPIPISTKYLLEVEDEVSKIGSVIEALVPNMTIGLKELSHSFDRQTGEPVFLTILNVRRNGRDIPIRYESAGVKRIISVLSFLIQVFNKPSATVAIDDLDAGICEFLFGELIEVFERNGKGQLLFTSHNFRPLEKIKNKKFIFFTTTNAGNKYARKTDIFKSNNLRDKYLEEGVDKKKKDEWQKAINAVETALKKAGGDDINN